MPYKVVLRIDADHSGTMQPITWEPGCPLIIDVLQVSRDVATGKAFLQARAMNLSDREVPTFRAHLTATFRDGTTEEFDIEPLDADIAPGGSYQITPKALERGDIVDARAVVLTARTSTGTWETSGAANPLPMPHQLLFSETALKERRAQLTSCSSMSGAEASRELIEHDGWWVCPCGQPNVGTALCARCHAPLNAIQRLGSEGELEKMAEQRAAQGAQQAEKAAKRRAKLKRRGLIGGIVAAIAIIVAGVYFGLVKPAITETCYVVASVTSYDEDVPGRVSSETLCTLDGHGNVTRKTFTYHSRYSFSSSDPYVYSYDIDPQTGFATSSTSTQVGETTATIESTDEYGQPTCIVETDDDGKRTTYTIEYHSKGHIKQIESESSSRTAVYAYDENGFRTAYRSEDKSGTSSTSSSYEAQQNGNVVIRNDTVSSTSQRTSHDKRSYLLDENGNVASVVYGDNPDSIFIASEYTYQLVENPSPWARAVSNLKPGVPPIS